MTEQLPPTYTIDEVVEALQMSERWVRDQINKHGAEHMRAGHKIRFTEKQYEALRTRLTVNAPVAATGAVTTGRKKAS